MAVRHPPENRVPPVASGNGRARRSSRIIKYQEPERGFLRRLLRRIFRPPVIIALVFLTTITVGVLGYYWYSFSGRIDQLLRGEIFTRSAGIYAAPKDLRAGQSITAERLIAYLQRAGYVEKQQQADSARGRYAVNGSAIEVEPGGEASVDGRAFPRLRIQFARDGKSIATITDLRNGARVDKAQLEPELISSVTGHERAKRKVVGFNDLPKNLVNAITVTEDRTFFEHHGVNLRGILRAAVRRYDADPNSPISRQGGSSITQQLVKNLLLSPEQSLRRKIAEAYMSIILETRLSKEEIFALYCNEVYLGQQSGFSINGFGEAADAYFGKDVTALTLDESAFLAGIIRSPNRYNPYHDLDTATSRRNQVLQNMAETGVITQLEFAQAQATPLKVTSTRGRIDTSDAPYFADYVQAQLDSIIGDPSAAQHLRVYTTIDMDLQREAYAAVTRQLSALDKIYAKRKIEPGTLQAALVAMDAHTGEIVAMVGGRDYAKSQLNHVTDAMRQPGSVFKPFVYATALNSAYDAASRTLTPATMYKDEPKTFTFDNQEYSPGNFGNQYSNAPVTLRDAIVRSLNVVTVDVAMDVTIGRVMNLATKAGLNRVPKPYPAMALGTSEATPLQIASAYTAFAAGGTRTTPIAINRVTTGNGVTVAAPTGQKNDVLRPDVAFVLTDFLKDVVKRGTAAKLNARGLRNVPDKIGIAGKTGTSRDGWFAGYTPNLVCVVWVGFDDNSQLGLTGADSALPIWADFMTAALAQHPEWNGDWQMPEGIQKMDIDPLTGRLASATDLNRRTEFFLNGTRPDEGVETETDVELPDAGEPQNNSDVEILPPSAPGATPGATPLALPSPARTAPPKLEGRGVSQSDGTTRLEGTITLDIDPTTGLIAASTCPVIRSKTFVLGHEPRKFCGPEYHNGKIALPAATRPRVVSP